MLPKIKPNKKTIYLDHAAATPVDARVKKAMEPFWTREFGNPSSLYKQGRAGLEAITNSRRIIAQNINARPEEIVFTAGGTESVNLAVRGLTRKLQTDKNGLGADEHGSKFHIITTKIEHHAVLNSVKALEKEGVLATYVGVDSEGFVNIDVLKKAVLPETVLVTVMYANNEVGTVEPIEEIGKWLKSLNAERAKQGLPRIFFHTDACQAAGALDLDVHRLGIDLMSVNASKIYGPKQVGFLYVRSGIKLEPIVYGGGQERDVRSGTENVPGIVGLAEAFKISQLSRNKENKNVAKLRDWFAKQLIKKISGIAVNGPALEATGEIGKGFLRLPNNLNVSFLGVDGEALLLYLDSYNIAVSTGSACVSETGDPSHVLMAIGRSEVEARSSVRFTLGRTTTQSELEYVLKVLPPTVEELRKVQSLH